MTANILSAQQFRRHGNSNAPARAVGGAIGADAMILQPPTHPQALIDNLLIERVADGKGASRKYQRLEAGGCVLM